MSGTLLSIRTMARVKSDQTNSTFPSDTEYNSLINEAAREVFQDMVMAELDVGYTTVTVSVAGSAPVSFAAGVEVMSVIGVYYVQGNQYYELKRVNPGHISLLRSTVGGYPEFYQIRHSMTGSAQQTIEVYPPQTGTTISIDYIPMVTAMAADGDAWLGPSGSDDLISLKAASWALRKEGDHDSARELDRQYGIRFEKLMHMMSRLDGRNGHQIRDVRGKGNYRLFDYQAVGPNGFDFGF